jgi:hypothetical protein
MFMYRLAKDLGRTITEIMQMSTTEFQGWIAFYKFEAEESKKAMSKAKARR